MDGSDCLDCVEVQIRSAVSGKRKDANTLSSFFVLRTTTFPIAKNTIAEPKELIRTSLKSAQPRNRPNMERNGIDYVFAVGLIFVAVIAVAELQYASFLYGSNQPSSWIQLIFVFKGTMVPIFVLVTVWLIAMIFPHVKIPLVRRRYAKEFCWALLGNVLALEILICYFLIVNIGHVGSLVFDNSFAFLPSFFLTLLATWRYRRIDSAKGQSAIRFGLTTVVEHLVVYFISYFLILMIMLSSIFVLL
jgi:hypothetical protein